MKQWLALGLLVAAIAIGAAWWMSRTRAATEERAQLVASFQRELDAIDGYYSADIAVAENSLLKLLEIETARQGRETKGDSDMVLGLIHGRLYLIYMHSGRNSGAEAHMKQALKYMDASLRSRGQALQSEHEKRQNLLQVIERLDQNREVKWKTKGEGSQK